VPIEPSDPSGLDTDNVRLFLRLNDDLFFLSPVTEGALVENLEAVGEAGARVLSFDNDCVSAGVAGEIVTVVSAGLARDEIAVVCELACDGPDILDTASGNDGPPADVADGGLEADVVASTLSIPACAASSG